MKFSHLPLKNLKKKPVRTAVLLLLITFLSLAVFGGSIITLSLKNGLNNLEARLGADIIVVPSSASSSTDLSNILLNGTTGYFYMSSEYLEKISAIEGVEVASAQIFFASMKASCCSSKVQIIGIDQETDFTIQPWISERYSGTLGEYEIVVGCDVNLEVGETLTVYENDCTVVARLDSTGTGLDTAVYCSYDTIRLLLTAAEELGHELKITGDPADVISCVYVRVQEGYDVETVTGNINVYVRKVKAVQTKSMLTSVSDSLTAIAGAVSVLIVVLWVLSFLILIAAFCLLINERRREFAVLRVLGASRGMLSRMILKEAALLGIGGGAAGIVLAACAIFPFETLIANSLGLPFLTPALLVVLAIGAASLLASIVCGSVASCYAAYRLSRVDAGNALREGN